MILTGKMKSHTTQLIPKHKRGRKHFTLCFTVPLKGVGLLKIKLPVTRQAVPTAIRVAGGKGTVLSKKNGSFFTF
jgi:hypothetical protein